MCKAELNWTTNLAAVERALHKGGHNSAKGADIIKVGTHEVADFDVDIRVFRFELGSNCFGFFGAGLLDGNQIIVDAEFIASGQVASIQRNTVLHINPITGRIFFYGLDVVPNLSLQADVGHDAVTRFGVHARHVICIGIAVRISVLNVE